MNPAGQPPRDDTSRDSSRERRSGRSVSSASAEPPTSGRPSTLADPLTWGIVSCLLAAVAAFLFRGLSGDEEAAHYLIARYAPGDPSLFLSLVGRPLVTLVLALPAQGGLVAARLASAVASGLAGWAVARILARTGGLHPAWGVVLLFVQPLFLAHAATAMTEPWTAAIVAWALVAWVERRPVSLALLAAIAPLARLELVAFWPLVAFALIRDRHRRAALVLLLPVLAWNLLGSLTSGDPLWLLHQATWRPYPERPPWHYLQCFEWIVGAGLLAPVVVGLTGTLRVGGSGRSANNREPRPAVRTPDASRRSRAGAAVVAAVYLVVYTTLAWWRPVTFGNLRYFASAAPAFAVLAAAGLGDLAGTRDRRAWGGLAVALLGATLFWNRFLFEDFTVLQRLNLLPVVAVAAVTVLHFLPPRPRGAVPYAVAAFCLASLALEHRGSLHLAPTPEEEAVASLAGRMRPVLTPGAVIYTAHPLLPFYLGQNPYDRAIYPTVTPAVVDAAPAGSFLFWEGHYTAARASLPPQRILGAGAWQFVMGGVARDSLWAAGLFRKTDGNAPPAAVGGPAWLGAARQAYAGVPRARALALADPENDAWWRGLARRYRLADMPTASAGAYLRATRLDPDDPDNDAFQAEVFRDMRRSDDAWRAIRRAVAKKPDDADMNFAAGLILLDMRRAGEARPYVEKALRKLHRRADVQYVAGRMYMDLREWEEAGRHFDLAIELNPDLRDARIFASETAAQRGDPALAERLLRGLIAREPGNSRGYLLLGDFLVRRNRPDEARDVWTTGWAATGRDTVFDSRLERTAASGSTTARGAAPAVPDSAPVPEKAPH